MLQLAVNWQFLLVFGFDAYKSPFVGAFAACVRTAEASPAPVSSRVFADLVMCFAGCFAVQENVALVPEDDIFAGNNQVGRKSRQVLSILLHGR